MKSLKEQFAQGTADLSAFGGPKRNPATCPHCKSEQIKRGPFYGQDSFICEKCNNWGPWADITAENGSEQ